MKNMIVYCNPLSFMKSGHYIEYTPGQGWQISDTSFSTNIYNELPQAVGAWNNKALEDLHGWHISGGRLTEIRAGDLTGWADALENYVADQLPKNQTPKKDIIIIIRGRAGSGKEFVKQSIQTHIAQTEGWGKYNVTFLEENAAPELPQVENKVNPLLSLFWQAAFGKPFDPSKQLAHAQELFESELTLMAEVMNQERKDLLGKLATPIKPFSESDFGKVGLLGRSVYLGRQHNAPDVDDLCQCDECKAMRKLDGPQSKFRKRRIYELLEDYDILRLHLPYLLGKTRIANIKASIAANNPEKLAELLDGLPTV